MTCRLSLIFCFILLCAVIGLTPAFAAPPTDTTPAAVTEDAQRLLELGQLLMGDNNPQYTLTPKKMSADARNRAGEQALRVFEQVTTLYPDFSDGWLWLGIARTEMLIYDKDGADGKPRRTPEDIALGVRAFRFAVDAKPDNLLCATFYGDALMVYLEDFDAARAFWENFYTQARSDLARVTAQVQASRACLNHAYFGHLRKTLAPDAIKVLFADAEKYAKQAAEIMPRAADVKAMLALLDKHRKTLTGSK